MKLEEEIKQVKPFASELEKALVHVMFTAGWLQNRHGRLLKPFSISSQQYNILRILKGQFPQPAAMGLLQERMLDKNSNASRLVDKLLVKEFVERKECPSDRRQVHVLITQKGIDTLDAISTKMAEDRSEYEHFSEDKAKQLNELLEELRNI